MKDFAGDDSGWADFFLSKAALILASIVIFAAFFHMVAEFKELEAQEQLDFLAQDLKTRVDEVEAKSLQEDFPDKISWSSQEAFTPQETSGTQEIYYYNFNDKEVFRALPFRRNVSTLVSGEYVCLEAESEGRNYRAVSPFAFRVLPLSEPVLHEKLLTRFGAKGDEISPLTADYKEILTFLQDMGTQEIMLDPEKKISMKKENIYIKDREGVFTFDCILVYQ